MNRRKILACSFILYLLAALPVLTSITNFHSISPKIHRTSLQSTVKVQENKAFSPQQKNSDYAPNQMVVNFKPRVKKASIKALNEQHGAKVLESPGFGLKTIHIPSHLTLFETMQRYEESPLVNYAEPNYLFQSFMTPNDPYYSYQWNYHSQDDGGINMEPAWDITTGEGTVVAVVDTGVSIGTDLNSTTFTEGHDFVNDDPEPTDNNGHGTHVTGTIAQSTNNGEGVAGIAYNATIMPIKALSSEGKGELDEIVEGIQYAVDNGADIINMSFGTNESSQALEEAVQYAYNHNVTCIAATGNSNKEPIAYPAGYDDSVIAVGATQYDKTRAPYSNYGPSIDLVAPGGNIDLDQNHDENPDGIIQQTFQTNGEKEWGLYLSEGTSSACPHVAGVATLLHSIGASSPDIIRDLLQSTATDLGDPGIDDFYGYGLINATDALTASDDFPPSLEIDSPKSAERIKSENVSISWTGSDALSSIDYYEIKIDNNSWISLGNTTTYQATNLQDGNHSVAVKAVDTANNSVIKTQEFVIAAPPLLNIRSPAPNAKLETSTVTVEWQGRDNGKIDHYEIQLNQGAWNSVNDTSYTFQDLDAGYYTVWIKAYDNFGYTSNISIEFSINYTPLGGPSWKEELIIGVGILVTVIALGIYFTRKNDKKSSLKFKKES